MAIEKSENEKNIDKEHFNNIPISHLQKYLMIESHELDLAVLQDDNQEILSECKDIINFAMFIMHKVVLK
jgi:phosphoribosyl-ATP pyrophosphohydrolase